MGITLSVPMPGHPIPPSSLDKVKKDFEQLEQLIDEHDVVFLGMDSRESRWLPTLLGGVKGKVSTLDRFFVSSQLNEAVDRSRSL